MTKLTTKLALGIACPLLAVAAIAPVGTARAQLGAAERAGEALDNAGRGIRRGVQNAFARTRTTVDNQAVISRVYSRLHWDKSLVGTTLELEVLDGGTAVLRGAVADPAAKQRAVLLARDTVGVTQVVDELTVLAPARVVPIAPTTTTVPATTTIINP